MKSGLIPRLNTSYTEIMDILRRPGLIFSLPKLADACLTELEYLSAASLATASSYLLSRKRKAKKEEKKRPYSEAAGCSGQLGLFWLCLCSPELSSFGPEGFAHGGEVEDSTVVSQQLGLAGGNRGSVPQTSCR